MKFHGTEQECVEVVAELDAALSYPRGYTQADIDSGLVVRVGGGIHVPLDQIRTETVAQPAPVEVDDKGQPIGDEHAVDLPELPPEHRQRVGRKRVLRLINRGTREQLVALPGLGPARADAIIARRAQGRMVSIEDLRAALPAAAMQALRGYALTRAGDEDADETGVAAKAVQK